MNKHNDGEKTVLYIFVGVIIFLLFYFYFPVASRHSHIVETKWITTTKLIEKYYDCDTDDEGNTDCDWEERELKSASLSGGVNDEISYPPDFNEGYNRFNRHSLRFVAVYQEEETKNRFNGEIKKNQFYGTLYVPNTYCFIKTSLAHKVISKRCVG